MGEVWGSEVSISESDSELEGRKFSRERWRDGIGGRGGARRERRWWKDWGMGRGGTRGEGESLGRREDTCCSSACTDSNWPEGSSCPLRAETGGAGRPLRMEAGVVGQERWGPPELGWRGVPRPWKEALRPRLNGAEPEEEED